MLLTAIESTDDPLPLVDAAYWLESACIFESQGGLTPNRTAFPSAVDATSGQSVLLTRCPLSLLKNAGLAHVHLVQNKQLAALPALPAPTKDFFLTISTGSLTWPSSADR